MTTNLFLKKLVYQDKDKIYVLKNYKYKLEPNEIINVDDDDVSINTISTKADEVIEKVKPVKKAGTIEFNFDCMNDE